MAKTSRLYHCKANISFFKCWSIVGSIPSHSYHLSLLHLCAVNNTCKKCTHGCVYRHLWAIISKIKHPCKKAGSVWNRLDNTTQFYRDEKGRSLRKKMMKAAASPPSTTKHHHEDLHGKFWSCIINTSTKPAQASKGMRAAHDVLLADSCYLKVLCHSPELIKHQWKGFAKNLSSCLGLS